MKFFTTLTAFLLCSSVYAQDPNFSQFYQLPLLRNPALCGIFNGDVRVQSVYRNQWQSVMGPQAYRTGGLSLEYKFPSSQSYNYATLGLQATYDIAGDSRLSRLQVLPVLSYHVNLSGVEGAYLTGAVMAGMVSSSFDPTQLKWDNQYQNGSYNAAIPGQVLKNTGTTYFDQGAGLSLTSPFGGGDAAFYVGAGLFHFLEPSVGFNANSAMVSKLPHKWAFNGGLLLPLSDRSRLNLFSDYLLQGGHRQLLAGAFYSFDIEDYVDSELDRTTLSLGSAYRWNDAFVPVIQVDYHHWSMGLSYDLNISKLRTASTFRGGLELTLNYKSFISSRAVSAYKVKCPAL